MKRMFSKLIGIIVICLGVGPFCSNAQADPITQPHLKRSGPNLLTNSNFAGNSGWFLYQSNNAAGVSRQNDGSGSINLPYNYSNPDHRTQSYIQSNKVPVVAGQVYTVAGYMYTASARHPYISFNLIVYDSNGRQISRNKWMYMQGVTASNQWQEIAGIYRPLPDDAYVSLYVWRDYRGEDNLSPDVWFDDAYIGTGIGFDQPPAQKQAFDGAMTRVDSLGNIEVNRNGTWEPFFPICVYGKINFTQADLNAYSKQGFNCLKGWFVDGITQNYLQMHLNAVSDFNPNGLMSMGEIGQYTIPSNTTYYNNIDNLSSSIRNLMSKPLFSKVFLSYYLDNEQYNQYPIIKAVTDKIKTLDINGQNQRNHFIFTNQGSDGITRVFDDSFDAVGDYLESNVALGMDNIRIIDNIQNQDKPITWSVVSLQSDPSGNGLRSKLYQSLIVGGKGIAVYSDPITGTTTSITTTGAWTALPQLRREVDQLLPLIRQPHWTSWSVTPSNALTPILIGTRDYNNDGYLILLNPSSSAATATYTLSGLPYKAYSISSYFDNSAITSVANNQFTISLPAYGTAVYRLVRLTLPAAPRNLRQVS